MSVLARLSARPVSEDAAPPARRRSRVRRALAVVVVLMVLAGVVATVFAVQGIGQDSSTRPVGPQALPTKPVTRGALTATVQVTGRLGYMDTYSVVGGRGGIVTRIPAVGRVVRRGQTLYDVAQRPIPLLYGSLPLYRTLQVGSEGDDVRELERNLVALGFADDSDLDVNREYTDATADAVRRWQDDLDVPETGTVAAGDAVVAPGELRVTTVSALVGQTVAPGQVVVTATGTGRGVHIDLSLDNQQYAHAGDQVTIDLPNGRSAQGKVTHVGTVASNAPQAPSGGSAGLAAGAAQGGGNSDSGSAPAQSIPVDVELQGSARQLGGLDQAPVSVNLIASRRANVLSVPVEALLATPSGGYGVTVVDVSGRHLVPVRTGLFASGRVEISGSGITSGTRVEVPTL